ncbi:MAG TPA: type VI secretion system baseplate subunit TssG [Pyrinomonadaceae bacterium]|nr:type VI secretion system baseplate subunit TssG [Pyrinomonadaceae bacterium]
MAAHGWGKDRPVDEWLYEEGYRFDFFQAVKLLELSRPALAPVGEGPEPAREPVRFKSAVGLAFPASDVAEVRPPAGDGGAAQMTVNFMGLAGALGPLHAPTTEQIIDGVSRKDTALRDFLDIFNHRLVSLLYRIRKVHRVGGDSRAPGSDRLSAYLYAAFGLGTPSLRGRMQVKDRALAFYAGLLGQQPRSMAGLERLLEDYFGVRARGLQFVGRWLELEEDQWTAIGAAGRNQRLGDTAVVGTRVWEQQGGFELALGPLSLEEFMDFLPTGWAFGPLCDLVRFYAGDELDFRVRLTLKAGEVPAARLGASGGARLGWTSWLKRADWPEEDLRLDCVEGPFCHLKSAGWPGDDSQVAVSPASLRAFAGAVRLPYFGLPPDKLIELVARMTARRFEENRLVVRQGDAGDSMFVIRRGAARVIRREADGRETTLATLREGDCFGEVSLLTGKTRVASVITLRECELLELTRADLDEFMALYPRFAASLRAYAERRNSRE